MELDILREYKYDAHIIDQYYDKKIKMLQQEIENMTIQKHIKLHDNKLKYYKNINDNECKELLKIWFDNMMSCCKQGTYGYRVSWSKNVPEDIFGDYVDTPHHWVCDYINLKCIDLVPKLRLYCELNNIIIKIADKAEYELWGN